MRLSEIESENERESEKESGSEIDPFRAWLFGDCLILVWGMAVSHCSTQHINTILLAAVYSRGGWMRD